MGIKLRSAFFYILLTVFTSVFTLKTTAQIRLFDNNPVIIDFNRVDGSGISLSPTRGQLNSNTWSITGLSDGNIEFGQRLSAGDLSRGISNGGVREGGIYAFEISSNDRALGFQPDDSDLTPGYVTLRIVNETGEPLTSLQLDYQVYYYNDSDRGNSVKLFYSTDNSLFKKMPEVDVVTPGNAVRVPVWQNESRSVSITGLDIPAGENIYVQWMLDDSTGNGTLRDEIALDNIRIQASGKYISSEVATGDLVISEIMANPPDGSQSFEYFELYNRTDKPIDLSGFLITNNRGESHKISSKNGETVISPYSFLVMGGSGFPGVEQNSIIDYTYGRELNLADDGETITIRDDLKTITRAEYRFAIKGIAQELVTIEAGHDGETFVEDYRLSSAGDNYGSGMRGSPGEKGDDLELSYGIKIAGNRGWKVLSAPVDGMLLSQFEDDTPIQGINDRFRQNLYIGYDGSTFMNPANLRTHLNGGEGFLIFAIDNSRASEFNETSPPDVLVDVTGSEPVTDVSVALHSQGDRWNLVGNPFTKPIDLTSLSTRGGNLASRVGQVWNDSISSFQLSTLSDNIIDPWQGFFIQNQNATNLILPKKARISDENNIRQNNSFDERFLAFELTGKAPSGNRSTTDQASVIYFNREARHGWDIWDAGKLSPLPVHLNDDYYSATLYFEGNQNGEPIYKAQDSRPLDLEDRTVIGMGINTVNMYGEFELNWDKINIPDNWQLTLEDMETGTVIDLAREDTYRFVIAENQAITAGEQYKMPFPVTVETESPHRRFRLIMEKVAVGINESVNDEEEKEEVKLNPNYPNPFNPTTTVSFVLTEPTRVSLTVHTIIGQKVATLVDEVREAGTHEETWNASDMPSGIYILQMKIGNQVFTRKMTLIK